MTTDVLNVEEKISFNEDIESFEFHQYTPFNTSSIGNSDEIRITMYQTDALTLPSQSNIYLEGEVYKESGVLPKLVNNAFAFLFELIRYEINGIEVDSVRNPGITSTLKHYASLKPAHVRGMENSGFYDPNDYRPQEISKFNVIIPLKYLMGFFEDYNKVLINAKQELILLRSRSDKDAFLTGDESSRIRLDKIAWNIPHLRASDRAKLQLYKTIEKSSPVYLAFRGWETHEYPTIPTSTKFTWRVKTSDQLQKPRYVLLAFQTGRRDTLTKDRSLFDSINVRNVRLFLNNLQYPYQDFQADFETEKISQIYDNYIRFRSDYYSGSDSGPLMTRSTFKQSPFIVINCAHQNESIKEGTVDIRLEVECTSPIPANTSAFCIILHDKVIEYTILNGLVRRY